MREKIFILLDELVLMSQSNYTTDRLELELIEIEKQIKAYKNKIKHFESEIDESKYYDISSQMLDKSLEIGLSKKIKKTENELEIINQKLQEALSNENNNHMSLEQCEKNLKDAQELLVILEHKSHNLKNEESKGIYRSLIEEYKEKISSLESEKENLGYEKQGYQNELNILYQWKEDLIKKLDIEKLKLKDTEKSLRNEKNYYNYELKREDEGTLKKLNNRLDELEKSKLALLVDPANLANEAKKLIVEGDTLNAVSKIKELVAVTNTVPYISETDLNMLRTQAEKIRANIDEKRNEISKNDYKTEESDVLESRVAYLNNLVEELSERVNVLKNIIENIDNKSIIDLKFEIAHAEKSRRTIENKVDELTKITKDNSTSTAASIVGYQKEIDSINKTIGSSNHDLEYLVELSCTLENNITDLENKIKEKKDEIVLIEREISLKAKLIDIKSKTNDEEALKKLESQYNFIQHRLQFNKIPQDVYNEIDCLLGSLDFDEPQKRLYTSRKAKNNDKETVKDENEKLRIIDITQPEDIQSNEIEIVDVPELSKLDIDNKSESNKLGFNDIIDFIGDK